MEAGESIDSVGHPASQTAPLESVRVKSEGDGVSPSQSQKTTLNDDYYSSAKDATEKEDGLPNDSDTPVTLDLDIISAIPTMDASTLSDAVATRSPPSENMERAANHQHSSLGQSDVVPGNATALSSIDPTLVTSAYNTPNHDQATPATAEDLASFDSLLASLMPTPQPGSPADHTPDDQEAEPASSYEVDSDQAAQSFVDTILRQANLYPSAQTDEPESETTAQPAASEVKAQEHSSGSDDALAASLEQFMASLQARVSSTLTAENDQSAPYATPTKAYKLPKKPKKVLGKRKYREIGPQERKDRVKHALSEYISSIDTLMKPSLVTGPIPSFEKATKKMTTIRCLHASVAQKSYGSEKRFFHPPPIVSVTGPLRRYADNGSATLTTSLLDDDADEEDTSKVSFLVKGEGNVSLSDEHVASLDERLETKIRNFYVAPTGKSKNFRLQLNLLRPTASDPYHSILSPLKKARVGEAASPSGTLALQNGAEGSDDPSQPLSRLPKGVAWASFESAPVNIISKSSRKTAKPRGQSNQVQNGSLISLFNRINSQTARTKYMHSAPDGRLLGHNGEWSTYRITLISRPPLADIAGAEEGSVTYGSTIVLTDLNSGHSSDPLVVCKVDKGQVQLPQIDPPAELLTAGTGNKSRRVAIEPALQEKLTAQSAASKIKHDGTIQHSTLTSTAQSNGAQAANSLENASETAPASSPVGVDLVKSPNASTAANETDTKSSAEDLNLYGPVGQLQKVALMRFVPSSDSDTISGDSEHLESDFSSPRSYLTASVPGLWKHLSSPQQFGQEPLTVDFAHTHEVGFGTSNGPGILHDVHKSIDSNSLTYVSPKTVVVPKINSSGTKVVDEVDDAFVWTVIGISRFEYSYFDTSATQASKDEGPCEVPMTPFPLITSMPAYDQTKHAIRTSVTNFIVPAAITSDPIPLNVWIGSLGPLQVEHSPKPASESAGDPEHFISIRVPALHELLSNANPGWHSHGVPSHFLLPLIFVNDSDGTAYQSGRHVVCEDLVQLMKATGHDTSAEMLNALGFGLGPIAGPPSQGAWSLRII